MEKTTPTHSIVMHCGSVYIFMMYMYTHVCVYAQCSVCLFTDVWSAYIIVATKRSESAMTNISSILTEVGAFVCCFTIICTHVIKLGGGYFRDFSNTNSVNLFWWYWSAADVLEVVLSLLNSCGVWLC